MWLKTEPASSILAISTPSRWICTACLTTLHHQLRRASTAAARTKTSSPSSSPKQYQPKRKLDPVNYHILPKSPTDLIPLPTLDFVIGVDEPPKPGQNPAFDPRGFADRWAHYWTKEGYEERDRKLKYELNRGYFADQHRLRRRRGKTFMAPDQPIQANIARYFPNFQGYCLANTWDKIDSSKLLMGKVSVVSYVREKWSRMQVDSFTEAKQNPALAKLLAETKEEVGLQRTFFNYEHDILRRILMYLCLPWARWVKGWEKTKTYVVTRGVDRLFLLHKLGITNTKVGYVYLVDANCKIRWAGNGDATEEERANLVKVLRRLLQERKSVLEKRNIPMVKKPAERKERDPKPLSAMIM